MPDMIRCRSKIMSPATSFVRLQAQQAGDKPSERQTINGGSFFCIKRIICIMLFLFFSHTFFFNLQLVVPAPSVVTITPPPSPQPRYLLLDFFIASWFSVL